VKLSLGCIADDYTGASDLANTLTRQGLRTVQTIGVPSDDLALPEVDAVVVSLKSRSIEADVAVERSRAREMAARPRRRPRAVQDLLDLRFHRRRQYRPVMDALRADSGDAIVLVTPAFPETGRTVYQGNLFVGSVPLNESPLKDHPLNPMHDSNLVRVLARQSRPRSGWSISPRCRAARMRFAGGSPIWRARASAPLLSTPCSTAISKPSAASRWIIACRSARPASASASPGRWSPPARSNRLRPARSSGAPVGGRRRAWPGAARRRRWPRSANAEKTMAVLHLDPEQIVAGPGEVRARWPGRATESAAGPILIASSSTPDQVQLCNLVMAAMQPGMPSSRRWPTSRRPGALRRAAVGGRRW
jgi:hypothetical protein